MYLFRKNGFLAIAGICLVACTQARADGLVELHSALDLLQGRAPISGELQAEVWNANGKGKERFETEGAVEITLADGAEGLQLRYGNEILHRMDAERQRLAEDPDAPTPTLEALETFTPARLQSTLSAAARLRRIIGRSRFLEERPSVYRDKPARLLTFERDISTVSQRQRKYVKEFQSLLHIWIGDDGTPLASRSQLQLKGSAFIFIRFRHENTDEAEYAIEAGRLVTLWRETSSKSSGGGERFESRTREMLQLGPRHQAVLSAGNSGRACSA